MNVEIMKKIMSQNKIALSFLGNQDWKLVKTETKKKKK